MFYYLRLTGINQNKKKNHIEASNLSKRNKAFAKVVDSENS